MGNLCVKSDGLLIHPRLNELLDPLKCTATDKKDIGGVDLDQLLMRVLPAALGWNGGFGSLDDLQQCLLHALTGNVSCDGHILTLPGDLVDLVNIYNSILRTLDIVVCGLN